MKRIFKALSVVAPSGQHIAQGVKTLEIRSWQPESLPIKDLLIVENQHYLMEDGQEEQGVAVALVDVESVHPWQNNEVKGACAKEWSEGYYAWVLSHIRLIQNPVNTIAKRKIYFVEIDHP